MKQAIERLKNGYQILIEKSFILFLILLAVNIATKIIYLDSESLWLDEASTLNWALHSFSHILRASLEDPNGPVFQILLKVWISVFGISEFAGRLLPALIGSLIIWPLYLLGKDLFDKRVAFTAIILCTLSNEILFWSHEIRSYTLVVFLSIWSFYFFFRIIHNGKKADVLWYWLISTLLVFTHLTATMVIVVQFFASFMFLKSKFKNVLFSYAGMALTTIGFGIWILNNNWIGGGETVWAPVPDFQSIFKLLAAYFNSFKVLYFSAFSLMVFLAATTLFKVQFSKGKLFATMLLWGLLPIVITYFGSIYYNPRFLTKYMLYVVPGLYLSVSVCLVYSIPTKRLALVLPLVFILLMSYFMNLNPEKSEKWRQAISFHNKYKNEQTFTVICVPYQLLSFSYYYNIEIFKDYSNLETRLLDDRIFLMCSLERIKEAIETEKDASRLILVLSHDVMVDPDEEVLNYMKDTYYLMSSVTQLRGIRVFVFDLKDTPHETQPDYVIDSIPIPASTYGNIFIKKIDEIENSPFSTIKVSCTINSKEELDNTHIVVSTRGDNPNNLWSGFDLKELVPNQDYQYESTFYISDNLAEGSDIAIYIWQPGMKRELVVKDIKISID